MSTNEKRINSRSIQKHDLEVNWLKATTFVPYKGELIIYDIEVDEEGNTLKDTEGKSLLPAGRFIPYTYERIKIGDGINTVSDLLFVKQIHPGNGEEAEIFNYFGNIASGDYSHAEGHSTTSSGYYSHAEGSDTIASAYATHAEGNQSEATSDYAHAEGFDTTASGEASHSEGYQTEASGTNSHAEGYDTEASGSEAHAEGYGTTASEAWSHAEGYETTASGYEAHAEGLQTVASEAAAHAEGGSTTAAGYYSHAEGYGTFVDMIAEAAHAEGYETTAAGSAAHAEGYNTTASSEASHAEGYYTEASGLHSHAEGSSSTASGDYSHSEGYETTAEGWAAHAEGESTTAAYCAHAEGCTTDASGDYSHAEGCETSADNSCSHAEGFDTRASGNASHAEGTSTTASGDYSHTEGYFTTASGGCSHAEGQETTASGLGAHVEGGGTVAEGDYSHAEGAANTVSGMYSHVEGYENIVTNNASAAHAEGSLNKASGAYSHVEGIVSESRGQYSHAEGEGTIAECHAQHVQGKYNIEDDLSLNDGYGNYAHIVGNGTGLESEKRSNAHTLDWEGNAWFAGDVYVGSTSGTNKDEGSKKLATEDQATSVTVGGVHQKTFDADTKLDKIESNGNWKFYAVKPSGDQTGVSLATTGELIKNGTLPKYWSKTNTDASPDTEPSGKGVLISSTPTKPFHVATKSYVDSGFLPLLDIEPSTRVIAQQGGALTTRGYTVSREANVLDQTIPVRTTGGHIFLPNNPTNNNYATNKLYVDSNFIKKTGGTVTGNLAITGNLQVQGTTETVDAVTYKIENNVIEFNPDKIHNETWLTGLAINKGLDGETDLDTYGIMYDPSTDAVKLGFGQIDEENKFKFNINESAPIATRDEFDDSWEEDAIFVFDKTTKKFKYSGKTLSGFKKEIQDEIKDYVANYIETYMSQEIVIEPDGSEILYVSGKTKEVTNDDGSLSLYIGGK